MNCEVYFLSAGYGGLKQNQLFINPFVNLSVASVVLFLSTLHSSQLQIL